MTKYDELYEIAKKEMGVAEVAGTQHNKKILTYHKATSLGATSDETPWCASFANWCLKEMGEVGTNSAAAKSFAKWGVELKKPVKGCIAVFTRTGGGHVAIFDHEDKDYVYTLGGNQGNRVCVAAYTKSRLLGYRGFDEFNDPFSAIDVKDLQQALNGFGAKLKVDGIPGPKTKAAMLKIAARF